MPVRAGHHWQSGMFRTHRTQLRGQFTHLRLQNFVTRRAQHHCVSEVIDIFRCASEMDEVTNVPGIGTIADTLADVNFDRLYVVIDGCFDFLDAFCIVLVEIIDDVIEHILHHGGQWREFRDARLIGEPLQPTYLDQYPITDQSVFAENIPEGTDLVSVATVDRGECS